jgi:hypothetical protein
MNHPCEIHHKTLFCILRHIRLHTNIILTKLLKPIENILTEFLYKYFKVHPMTKHRPKCCGHPPFDGIDYCWGLGISIRDNKKMDCSGCDLKKI